MKKKSAIYIAWHRGLVGSAMVKRLQTEWYENLLLANKQELNLLDQSAVDAFFERNKPEYVIICAAKVGWVMVNATYPFDMFYENLQIQSNIIGAANQHGVKKLLFIASSTIYPSDCIQPIIESELLTGPLDPLHESYGLAKICGIKLCEKLHNQSPSKEFFTLVPTNIYGVGDHFEESRAHVIGSLMTRFYRAKQENLSEVAVWWSWKALREFLYVDDLVDAIYFFMTRPISSSFINIGTDQEISIKELAYLIKEIIGFQWNIVFDTTKPEGRLRRKLDTNLASSYGWDAHVSLQEWLQKTYQYFLSTL